jgi:HPt (histidine-containing phosphotransfer) domain-containing protein
MPEGATAADLLLLDPDGTFPARLADDRDALARLARGLRAASPARRDRALAEIEALAHRLAGAAGTFGYGAVGDAALELEHGIATARRGSDRREGRATVDRCLAGLLGALDHALGTAARAKRPQD